MSMADLPRDFIPTRHGAQREKAKQLLGGLRLVAGKEAEPSPERWHKIGLSLMHGDPLMDDVVDWMFKVGMATARPLYQQAVAHGIATVPKAPDVLRRFFEHVERRPDWVDMKLVAEGGRVIGRGGMDYFYIGRDLALMGGYQASAFNKTLLLTGALKKGPVRRVAETAQWHLDCSSDGGMEPFAIGYQSTLQVRLIHAIVRRHVPQMKEWRMKEWGLPVNQIDMAATALAFPLVMLLGGRAMGVLITRRDSLAAMHHGRYAAWLMGVEEQWLPHNEREGRKLLYQLSLSITNPDDTSEQLGSALRDEPLHRPYKRFGWLLGRYRRAQHLSVSSLFLSPASRRSLGLPATTLPWYPLLRLPLNLLRHTTAHFIPGARARLAVKGREASVAYLRSMTGDTPAQVGQAAHHLTAPSSH